MGSGHMNGSITIDFGACRTGEESDRRQSAGVWDTRTERSDRKGRESSLVSGQGQLMPEQRSAKTQHARDCTEQRLNASGRTEPRGATRSRCSKRCVSQELVEESSVRIFTFEAVHRTRLHRPLRHRVLGWVGRSSAVRPTPDRRPTAWRRMPLAQCL